MEMCETCRYFNPASPGMECVGCRNCSEWDPRGTEPVAQTDNSPVPGNTQDRIRSVCREIADFLVEKNKAYGDSAANPVQIFSNTDPLEQINIRIDDKLSRMARGSEYQGDDTELDLIGYLILKRVIRQTIEASENT